VAVRALHNPEIRKSADDQTMCDSSFTRLMLQESSSQEHTENLRKIGAFCIALCTKYMFIYEASMLTQAMATTTEMPLEHALTYTHSVCLCLCYL